MTTPARPSLAETLASLTLDGPNLAEFWTLALAPSKARGMVKRIVTDERTVRIDELLDDGKGPRCGGVGPVRWTVDDAAQAFERLTNDGVIPQAWTDDPTRLFWHGVHQPRPRTIADLVAWSSLGVAAILRAEELARDVVTRLARWGVGRRERRVVWRVAAAAVAHPEGWPSRDVRHVVTYGRYEAEHKLAMREGDPFAPEVAYVRAWPDTAPPCPYAPLLDLLRTGFALGAITDRALVLVVPPLA